MNLPSPPTDNLYKFVALAGVLAVLTAISLMTVAERTNDQSLMSAWAKQDSLVVEALKLTAKLRAPARTATARQDSVRAEAEYRRVFNAIEDQQAASRESTSRTASDISALWVLGFVGFVLAVVGFVLWSTRVQYWEDVKTIREVATAKPVMAHPWLVTWTCESRGLAPKATASERGDGRATSEGSPETAAG